MRLEFEDRIFGLTILAYQYPDAAGEPYDANWLRVGVEAGTSAQTWRGEDACLLTYEAARLAKWLEDVGSQKPAEQGISFLEPALLFHLVGAHAERVLRIHFGNLINPIWRAALQAGQSNDLFLDFPLKHANLVEAGEELRRQLRKYPDRAQDRGAFMG